MFFLLLQYYGLKDFIKIHKILKIAPNMTKSFSHVIDIYIYRQFDNSPNEIKSQILYYL